METIPFAELPADKREQFGPAIERLLAKESGAAPLPPPPAAANPQSAIRNPQSVRPFRAHFLPSLGEEVFVTYADLNDGLFIAEHAPAKDPSNIHGFVLQVVRCTYRRPEHRPEARRFRLDAEQDDRPFLREVLSFEELVDLVNISSALGRRSEYLSEGIRDFLSATQTFFAALSGHSSTCTGYPTELREQQKVLMSAAFALTSAVPSTSGTVSDAAE